MFVLVQRATCTLVGYCHLANEDYHQQKQHCELRKPFSIFSPVILDGSDIAAPVAASLLISQFFFDQKVCLSFYFDATCPSSPLFPTGMEPWRRNR